MSRDASMSLVDRAGTFSVCPSFPLAAPQPKEFLVSDFGWSVRASCLS